MPKLRPYYRDTRGASALWIVPASPCAVRRPNRVAAGMSATYYRRKRRQTGRRVEAKGVELHLVVKGTLDDLAGPRFDVTRVACACCGSIQAGKLRLNRKRPRRPMRTAQIRKLDPARLP